MAEPLNAVLMCLADSLYLTQGLLLILILCLLQVYKLSIGAVCALTWPPDRIIIQVLDDSTDPIIKVSLDCSDKVS